MPFRQVYSPLHAHDVFPYNVFFGIQEDRWPAESPVRVGGQVDVFALEIMHAGAALLAELVATLHSRTIRMHDSVLVLGSGTLSSPGYRRLVLEKLHKRDPPIKWAAVEHLPDGLTTACQVLARS